MKDASKRHEADGLTEFEVNVDEEEQPELSHARQLFTGRAV